MRSAGDRTGRGMRPCGFTLVELLVVVALIATLIGILLPSLARAREDARRTVCLANLKHVGLGLFSYASDNRDFGPAIMSPDDKKSPRTLLSREGSPVNMGHLLDHAMPDPAVLRCPSQRRFHYESEPTHLQDDTVAGSYAYAVHVPAEESPRFANLRHLAMVSDDFSGSETADGVGLDAHRDRYNVLYTDGSASQYGDGDESIWRQRVDWDDETDRYNYASYYDPSGKLVREFPPLRKLDVFRVWHAFCYSTPDPF